MPVGTSNDQHLSLQKVQRVHLMMNKKDVFDEEKKGNRKDDDEVGQEKDVYDIRTYGNWKWRITR